MPLKDWLNWIKSKPLYLRWFIFFLLLRPIAEQFYNLKEISPLLSPLYWLGVLTLIFSIIGIMKGRRVKTNVDRIFLIWSFLVILAVVLMFMSSISLIGYLNFAVKLTLPVFVYFFLRVFIQNKTDLVGLITTFLISSIVPIGVILTGLSGGALSGSERFSGKYADVFNNAFYLSMGLIALLYLFIHNRSYVNSLKIRNSYVALSLIISLLGLWVIKHIATVVVMLAILAIFIYVVFRKHRSSSLFLIIISIIIVFSSGDRFYQEVLDPRIEKEVEVLEGSRGISQGVHGRMSRWTWLTTEFRAAPLVARIAGYPFSLRYSNYMVGITPHNDFLRILFLTGYTGLALYLLLLYKVYRRMKYKDIPDRFLLSAVLFSTILYSITTVPTFYPGYINILMIAFAYSALPVLKPTIDVR